MRFLLAILLAFFVVILQTAGAPLLAYFKVAPNLVLCLVLSLVFLKSFNEYWRQIFLVGLLTDFFSALPFGLIALSLILTAYLISWINKSIFNAVSFWVMAGLTFLGSFVYNVSLIGLCRVFLLKLPFTLKSLILESAYNILITIFFFYVAKKILR